MNRNKTLFLIEDNPDDIDLTINAFQPYLKNRTIQTARDGEEALTLLSNWKESKSLPSLILLDLNLPKINGLELLRILKTNPNFAAIPIIILTASTEEEDIIQAYKFGTNSYLNKPVDFSQFLEIAAQINTYWNCLNISAY